jgi:hypothetical protein
MKNKVSAILMGTPSLRVLLAGIVILLLTQACANAAYITSLQTVSANAGSSGNGLDVLLNNTGPSAVTVGAFSFGVSAGNASISFTDATTGTLSAPYIFGTNSLFGPDLTGPTSGQSLTTSDVFAIPGSGITLASGATVGLGHLLFSVAPGTAAGIIPVTVSSFPVTSLADAAGANLSLMVFPGSITIVSTTAVPEPSTLAIFLAAGAVLSLRSRFQRK